MPRESAAARRARVLRIIDRLRATYPEARCELDFQSPLELLVATILSAQCSDRQVNRITAQLFRKYRSAADYAASPPGELEEDIRQIGLFRNKARSIRSACRTLVEHHHGRVPASMEDLLQLDGVGRKTANVVLGNAFNTSVGIVVDTHVARLSARLGLVRDSNPIRIERALMNDVPPEAWTLFSHWLIWHGRRRCSARKPDCPHCEISDLCPSSTRPANAPPTG